MRSLSFSEGFKDRALVREKNQNVHCYFIGRTIIHFLSLGAVMNIRKQISVCCAGGRGSQGVCQCRMTHPSRHTFIETYRQVCVRVHIHTHACMHTNTDTCTHTNTSSYLGGVLLNLEQLASSSSAELFFSVVPRIVRGRKGTSHMKVKNCGWKMCVDVFLLDLP